MSTWKKRFSGSGSQSKVKRRVDRASSADLFADPEPESLQLLRQELDVSVNQSDDLRHRLSESRAAADALTASEQALRAKITDLELANHRLESDVIDLHARAELAERVAADAVDAAAADPNHPEVRRLRALLADEKTKNVKMLKYLQRMKKTQRRGSKIDLNISGLLSPDEMADAKRVATTAGGTTTTVTPAPDVISSLARLQKIQKRLGWSTSLLNRYTEHHQFDNDEVGDEEGGDEAAASVDHAVLLGVSETEATWDVTTAVEADGHDEVGDGDGAAQDGGDEVVLSPPVATRWNATVGPPPPPPLDIGTEASGDAATTAGGSYAVDCDAEDPVTVAPDGWREAVDSESGRTYFFNDATEQSQWDCPPELGGADVDRDAAMDAAMPDAGIDTEMYTSLESTAADDSAADDSVLSRSLRIAEIEETARSLANDAHLKDVKNSNKPGDGTLPEQGLRDFN